MNGNTDYECLSETTIGYKVREISERQVKDMDRDEAITFLLDRIEREIDLQIKLQDENDHLKKILNERQY